MSDIRPDSAERMRLLANSYDLIDACARNLVRANFSPGERCIVVIDREDPYVGDFLRTMEERKGIRHGASVPRIVVVHFPRAEIRKLIAETQPPHALPSFDAACNALVDEPVIAVFAASGVFITYTPREWSGGGGLS